MNFTINPNAFSNALSQIFGCTPKTAKTIKTDWGRVILRAYGSTLLAEIDTDSVSLRATLPAAVSIIEEGSVSVNSIDLLRALHGLDDQNTLSATIIAATDDDPALLALHASEKIFVKMPAKLESRLPQPEVVEFQIGRTDFLDCARVSSYTRDRNAMHAIYVRRNSLSAICEGNGFAFIWQKQGMKVAKTTNPVDLFFHRLELNALINALSMNPATILKCERRDGVKSHLAIDAGCSRLLLTIPRKHNKWKMAPQVGQSRPNRFILPSKELVSALKSTKRIARNLRNAKTHFVFDCAARTLHLDTAGNGRASQIIETVDSFMPDDSTGILQVSFLTRRLLDAFSCQVTGAFLQIDFNDGGSSMRVAFDAKDRVCDEVWKRNDELSTRERLVMFCAGETHKIANAEAPSITPIASPENAPQVGELSHA